MNLKIKRILIVLISIISGIVLLLTGCVQGTVVTEPTSTPAPAATTPKSSSQTQSPTAPAPLPPPPPAPSLPVVAKLSFSDPPVLGKPVELKATITLLKGLGITEANNTSFEMILPEGFEVVSGNLKGTGDIKSDQATQYQVVVKSVKTGSWKIEFVTKYYAPGYVGNVGVAAAYLYAIISENSAQISDVPTGPKIGTPTPAPPPPGWKPPTGLENVPPATPSPPRYPEPPRQYVPPAQIPSSVLPKS